MKIRTLSHVLFALVPAVGCGTSDPEPTSVDGEFEGIEEANEALTDLSSACSFTASSGLLTVTLASADIALIAKSTAGNITINGFQCGTGATGTTLKRITVTGAAGAETLILDLMGGEFAKGATGVVGIDVDLGAGTDALKIRGGKSADTIVFGSTGIAFNGDAFRDIVAANVENFTVSLSDGADTFSAAGNAATGGAAFASAVVVYGGAGADSLTSGGGNDTFHGGADNDTFVATASDGNDVFNGDAGTDTVDYSSRSAALTITIDGMADDGASGETDTVSATIEAVKGGSGNDSITGSANADTLSGGGGDDTLVGGGGVDVLNGEAGNDTFDEGMASNGGDTFNGGAGTDTVSYASRSNPVIVTVDTTANDGESGELDKVLTDVENVTGGGGADTITGSTADNVLDGGAGADILNGGGGADTLRGGAGADTLNGDAGDDTFDEGTAASGADVIRGGLGVDTVSYAGRTNAVTVVMDGATGSGETGEGDVIHTDCENLTGGDGADSLTGNASENTIQGGADDDAIFGLGGDDLVDGDAGSDDVDCGDGDADILLDATVDTVANCEL